MLSCPNRSTLEHMNSIQQARYHANIHTETGTSLHQFFWPIIDHWKELHPNVYRNHTETFQYEGQNEKNFYFTAISRPYDDEEDEDLTLPAEFIEDPEGYKERLLAQREAEQQKVKDILAKNREIERTALKNQLVKIQAQLDALEQKD